MQSPEPALVHLLDALGALSPDVAHAPPRRGLGELVVHDRDDPPPLEAGDVVLAVGLQATELPALLERAGLAGAAAVLAKRPAGPLEPAVEAARHAGVGLLVLPRGADWSRVVSLARLALARDAYEHLAEPLATLGAGDDMSATADAIAAVVGAPVTIEDASSRLIGHSRGQDVADAGRTDTILGRGTPSGTLRRLREDGVFRALATTEAPLLVRASEAGALPRLAMPIRAGDELLGTLWATVREEPDGEVREAFAAAARVAALQILHDRAAGNAKLRSESELVRRLLLPADAPVEAAARLGLSGTGFRVLAVSVASPAGRHRVERAQLLASSILRLQLASSHLASASGEVEGVLYAVLAIGGDAARTRAEASALAARLLGQARRGLPPSAIVGIGGHADAIEQLPAAREQADTVLRVLRELPRGTGLATFEDVWPQVRLLRFSEAMAADAPAPTGPLAVIVEHDAVHGTAYRETLEAYLDAFGDTIRVGRRLHVHPATVRYRMRRIAEIGALRLDDPQQRLALMLELHVERRRRRRDAD